MSEANRPTPAPVPAEPAPARPFEKPEAGADYFETQEHFLSLARRIAAALGRGCRFAVVTGDPPPDPPLLFSTLATTIAGSHAVLRVPCGSEFSIDGVLRVLPGHFAEQPQLVPSKLPLLAFGEADNLTEKQLDALFEVLISSDTKKVAAALSGHPALLTRLEALKPRFLNDGSAASFKFRELGPEEIETFVRRQLPATDSNVKVFAAEAIAAIAEFSGGDPALVNRLSRLMVELEDSAGAKKKGARPTTEAASSSASETVPEGDDALATAPPKRPRLWWSSRSTTRSRPRRGIRVLQAAFILCVAVALLMTDSDKFSSLTGLAQRGIASVTAQITDLRSKIVAADPDGITRPPLEQAPVAVPTKELSPLDNRVAPSISSPNQGTQAPTTNAPAPPPAEAEAVSPAREPEPIASPSVITPEPAKHPEPDSSPAGATTPRPEAVPQIPASETAALVARGDALVSVRDLASARLFYERAAEMGDGHGALRMGMTFDPAFLQRAAIRGGQGDQQKALLWYRRARDLGDAEADRLLKNYELH